ncbi:MAG: T9SS type A sorting domain-containing protein, partial [Bacteroidetes bacterium]|nr:T9SS type A sorting domain-containing protein [Bacteroidota bacterium]
QGPCNSKTCLGSPGYTGYKTTGNPTQRIGAIAIDRNTNDMYFGYGTQTTLPGGLPDFEPAVVAMDKNGTLKWWSRLYKETTNNSTPDQYVDGMAFDPARNMLIVLARCHGNNTDNYWSGNTIAANSGASGFQNQFTGNVGNIHISWLGKFKAADGTLMNSTYVAEFPEGSNNYGPALTNPNMDNWPNPSAGWPNVNTTRCGNKIAVGSDGSITITGTGRRTMTTKNAFQKMPLPTDPAKGSWNYFVRTYASDLSKPLCSSLLTGIWDTSTGAGGSNVTLNGVCRIDSGVVIVGYHNADATTGVASGNAMPIANIPGWGNASPVSEQAVFAKLVWNPAIVSGISAVPSSQKQFRVYPNPVNSDEFHIDNPDGEKLTVNIYTTLGTKLYSITETKNEIIIPVSKWINGIYFVDIITGSQHSTQKVIIQK